MRKNRRANIDFVEKKCLIDFLYVDGYLSHRRGGLMPGSRRPRYLTGDPKTSISVVEASSRAGIKLSTAKSIHRKYVEGGFKFMTRNEAFAARKPRRKKLQGLEKYLHSRLHDWVHNPLSRRVEIIKEELDI